MSNTSLVLGTNWQTDEWPEYVSVIHESDVAHGFFSQKRKYVPERTCELTMVYEDDEGTELNSSAPYFRHYKCSSCGDIKEHNKHEYWIHCPHCGAKVVE